LDWRNPATRDAIVLLALTAILFAVAHVFDLPPHLLQFGLDHADWEVDDLIFVVFVLSVALMVFAFRRYRDSSAEIRARIRAEAEA
jgi:membrane protease YdiL (CAAX protease family)